MRRGVVLTVLATMLALAVAGTGAAAQDDTVVVALSSTLTTLETQDTTDTDSAAVRFSIYEGLVTINQHGETVPELAESWDVSEDGRTYTFYLRKGIKFHDGTPFNAEAVKVNFDRLMTTQRNTSAGAYFTMLESVEAVDEYTVVFRTKEPFGPFIRHLGIHAAQIMSPAAIEKWGDEVGQHPVGTGPWKFVEWVRGDHVTLERNEDYWREKPGAKRLIYRIVPEPSTRVAMLETGEADVILRVTPEEVERLSNNPNIRVFKTQTARSMFFSIHTQRPHLADPRVRQALNYAVDKEAIVKSILGGAGVVADSPLGSGVFGYTPIKTYEYNPQKARQLLTEAGYANRLSITIAAPRGRYVQDWLVAQAVQAQLQAIGIKAQLNIVGDFASYIQQITSPDRADLMFLGWAPSTLDGEGGLYQILHGDRANQFANSSAFDNDEFDRYVDLARTSTDQEQRLEYYQKAQEIAVEEAPMLFMYYQAVYTAVRDRIEGVYVLPSEQLIMREVRLK
ncbi:MAG: glutathione ABC transporter substrate-binding protein [Firmicutes bacterium]|nr:glutathione ABC transporter substrate-binding protein [Bacillota bacterium]